MELASYHSTVEIPRDRDLNDLMLLPIRGQDVGAYTLLMFKGNASLVAGYVPICGRPGGSISSSIYKGFAVDYGD